MTISSRRQSANRENARRSTGPRTAEGKAKASRNAVCHGLSIRITGEDGEEQIERLATGFQQGHDGPGVRDQARLAAEATLELARIRQVRELIFSHRARCIQDAHSRLANSRDRDDADDDALTVQYSALRAELAPLDRYMTRALSRRRTGLRRLQCAISSTQSAGAGEVVQE